MEITDDGKVCLIDGVKEWVVTPRNTPRPSENDPKVTATISITNADVRVVQRFFWDLTEHSMSTNFDFKHVPDAQNIRRKRIQVNEIDSHLLIVKQTFGFMNKKTRSYITANWCISFPMVS